MANTTMPSRLFLEPDNQYETTPTYYSEPHSPSQSEHSNSTFSSYGHTRMSSSASSYSSSPPSEQRSSILKRSALPDVAEDPHERVSQAVRGSLSFGKHNFSAQDMVCDRMLMGFQILTSTGTNHLKSLALVLTHNLALCRIIATSFSPIGQCRHLSYQNATIPLSIDSQIASSKDFLPR